MKRVHTLQGRVTALSATVRGYGDVTALNERQCQFGLSRFLTWEMSKTMVSIVASRKSRECAPEEVTSALSLSQSDHCVKDCMISNPDSICHRDQRGLTYSKEKESGTAGSCIVRRPRQSMMAQRRVRNAGYCCLGGRQNER
jgi:hypothetical protein